MDIDIVGPLLAIMVIWGLVGLAFIVWYLWALSRLFPKIGLASWEGWVPVWNQWRLIERGGLPGWTILLSFVALGIVPFIMLIIAMHRINREAGESGGMTVLGVFIAPLWAMLLASRLGNRVLLPHGAAGMAYPAPTPGAPMPPAPHQPQYAGPPAPLPPAASVPAPPAVPTPPVAAPQPAAHHAPPQPPAAAPSAPFSPAPSPAPAASAPAASASRASMPPEQPRGPIGAPPLPSAPSSLRADEPARPANEWNLSNTTEREYERLAAEGFQAPPGAPLAPGEAPKPFAWPASHGPLPSVAPPPAPPAHPASSPVASAPPAPASPAVSAPDTQALPVPPAGPPAPPAPVNAAPPAPAAPSAGPAAAPATTPVRVPSASQGHHDVDDRTIISAPPEPAEDLDQTVVVPKPRRIDWVLELPDGEELERLPDTVVGRKPSAPEGANSLVIEDPTRTLSKSHARFRYVDGRWTVEDLGSTNGTTLIGPDGEDEEIVPHAETPAPERILLGTLEVLLRQRGDAG